MKKTVFTLFMLIVCAWTGYAQTATEAYRLSYSYPFGTARNIGTGNSMMAIGADFSAIALNPAGIAGYWKSEFLVTGDIGASSFTAHLDGDPFQVTSGSYGRFRLGNLGFVVANQPGNGSVKTSNWAIGLNRMADYQQDILFDGHTKGSITDAWREKANGHVPDDLNGFEEGLAYTSGAIYDLDNDLTYETDYELSPEYALYKNENAVVRGGNTELFLGYGANLNQKIMIGFSVNLPFINANQSRQYLEMDDASDAVPYFNDLGYISHVNTTGFGFNGKFGVTVKPARSFNLSFAVHTPTYLHLTDNFETSLTYDYTDENHNGPITSESDYGTFQYGLHTPWSLLGGAGLIIGKNGFIGAGIKWTDYGAMKFKYNVRGNGTAFSQQEREVNESIRKNYTSSIILNAGGELALQKFRIRAGFTLNQSPYINDNSFDPAYHAGIGYRDENYYIDLGYKYAQTDEGYLPYETMDAPQPLALISTNHHQLAMTVGFKF